jgi:hypothetical protein
MEIEPISEIIERTTNAVVATTGVGTGPSPVRCWRVVSDAAESMWKLSIRCVICKPIVSV